MTLTVRPATPGDEASLAALLAEMQAFYAAPVPEADALETARLLCNLPPEGFNPRTLLALHEDQVIGSCVLNVMLPAAELRRSLYIRDLFVSARSRRKGVGHALIVGAAQLVREGGFCALDWTTDSQNLPARRLYDGIGGRVVARTYYRVEERTMDALLAGEAPPSPPFRGVAAGG